MYFFSCLKSKFELVFCMPIFPGKEVKIFSSIMNTSKPASTQSPLFIDGCPTTGSTGTSCCSIQTSGRRCRNTSPNRHPTAKLSMTRKLRAPPPDFRLAPSSIGITSNGRTPLRPIIADPITEKSHG